MEKKIFLDLTQTQIKSGIRKALLNASTLAGYSKDIIERGGKGVLALGLYSFAIEEYGKSILLSELLNKNQKTYHVPVELFQGKKSHDLKFKKALSILPSECTSYESGVARSISNIETQTSEVGIKGKTIAIPAGITGIFSEGDLEVDFETRMSCFYLDWDDLNNKWKSPPKVLPEELEKTIINFENHLTKKLDKEYDVKGSQ
jgi:AbiV family abortive infection protein